MQINRHKCNEIASYFRIFMLNLQANLIFISGFRFYGNQISIYLSNAIWMRRNSLVLLFFRKFLKKGKS